MAYIKKRQGLEQGATSAGAGPTSYAQPGPPLSAAMSPGATTQSQPKPQASFSPTSTNGGSGWLNLQDYLGVNGSAGQGMAGQLAGGVSTAGQAAQSGAEGLEREFGRSLRTDAQQNRAPTYGSMAAMSGYGDVAGKASDASRDAKGLVSFSDRQRQLSDMYGKGNDYSAGMRRWDSFAAGAVGGDELKSASDMYGGLAERLGVMNEASGQKAGTVLGKQGEVRTAALAAEKARTDQDATDRDWYSSITNDTKGNRGGNIFDNDFTQWQDIQSGALHGTWFNGGATRIKEIEDRLAEALRFRYGADFADRYARLKGKYGG